MGFSLGYAALLLSLQLYNSKYLTFLVHYYVKNVMDEKFVI